MKRLVVLLAVASMFVYSGMALAQTTGKTQAEKPPGQTQPQAQDHEKHHPQAQSQEQPEMGIVMMCPGMLMMQEQMPPEMQQRMQERLGQMMKGQMAELQKQIDALRQRVDALEKKK